MIRFQTFEQIHNKKNTGSTRIRVLNLIKYWPEAELYKYGENPDVLIFQKVYCTQDYKFPKFFENIKILDICDPDWLEGVLIKETVDAMDAIVCPTEPLRAFLRQLTDKPVVVIKDRFDVNEFPPPKRHEGKLKTIVWFGYSHNLQALKLALPSIKNRNLRLIVISNENPRYEQELGEYYTYYKYNQVNLYKQLQEADVAVFPIGNRPQDKFKSENKTVIAQLCGLPVAKTAEELDALIEPKAREKDVKQNYERVRKDYDVLRSIEEYKKLIQQLSEQKGQKDGK